MANLTVHECWLRVYSTGGTLLTDYSSVDIPELPVMDPDDPGINTGYGVFRQIEWLTGNKVILAWRVTSPEGQISDFGVSPVLRHRPTIAVMDLEPSVTWTPGILPVFRWNLLPRDLNP